jgi:hypothetical protein
MEVIYSSKKLVTTCNTPYVRAEWLAFISTWEVLRILTEVFCDFPQFLQAGARIIA